MNLLIWLLIGGLIGWAASILMGTDDQQGIILNVVIGIAGAFLGGVFLSGLFGTSTINEGNFSAGAVLVSLLGAITLIAILKLVRGVLR